MSNVFKTVNNTMSIIICWIDAPLASRVWMAYKSNSVCNEISHVWIGMLHVHLNSEAAFSFFESSLSHHFEQLKVFFDTSVSVLGILHSVSAFFHFFRFLMANVSFVFLDESNSHVVEFLEVIR